MLRGWLVLLLMFATPCAVAAERLRLHGSNTIGERLAPALVQAWMAREGFTDIGLQRHAFEEVEIRGQREGVERVVEIHAHGSSTGFADLASGHADIAMSSRPVKASDLALHPRLSGLAQPEQEWVLALDGLAIIVHPDNPLPELGIAQLSDLFSGRIRDWSQLDARLQGPVRLHARDDRSGTFDSFRALVLGDASLHAGSQRYESTEQLAAAVAADRQAIGFVGLSGLRGVRALPISDGGAALPPSIEDVAVEDYALSRRLYLYLPADADELAHDFARFALADAGQAVVEANGFVAQSVRGYAYPPRQDAPAAYRALVDGAERLSLNFRFGAGSRLVDSKTLRDLDRLATFMQQPQYRQRPLILLGFSDAVEVLPAMALFVSTDRADYIAQLLIQRGVDPARVRGLGGAAPVASNSSDLGRQRNRRVEVWLGRESAAPEWALQARSGLRR